MKEFGMLMVLGMSKKQFNRLIFLENMMIGSCSIVAGIIIGLVFSKFFLLIGEKILSVNHFNFYFPVKAIILTIVGFFILFMIISALTPILIRSTKIIELLKRGKEPNREIKFSWLLSVLGFVCLIGGYGLALSFGGANTFLNDLAENLGNPMLVITIIVSIGTYFFFSQLSILMIDLFKKKQSFYMKKTNMLWISDLAYRIRDNARMLFIVTILSAIAFTAISSLYILSQNVKSQTTKVFPYHFTYIATSKDRQEGTHIKALERQLNKHHFSYKKHVTHFIKQEINGSFYFVMSESDYNKNAHILHRKTIHLGKTEAYLIPNYPNVSVDKNPFLSQKTVSLNKGHLKLSVIDRAEGNILPSGLGNTIIVNDKIMNSITPIDDKMTYYGYQVKNWEKTYPIAQYLQKKFERNSTAPSFYYFASSDLYHAEKLTKNLMLYIGFFIGVIFFIAAASFLYFRLYTDLNKEQEKYYNLSKVGLSEKEMKKTSTIQIAILLFAPFVLAAIHTMFALGVLESMMGTSLRTEVCSVLAIFTVIEVIFFIVIRSRYVHHLKQYINR
nr:ABC transporter permease [Scopulibacillus daqui]